MSLLNDALKAAEQRQSRPAPSPYTGQGHAAPARRSASRGIVAGVGLMAIAGLVGYAGWQFATVPEIPSAGQPRSASLDQPITTAALPEHTGRSLEETGQASGMAVMASGEDGSVGPLVAEPEPTPLETSDSTDQGGAKVSAVPSQAAPEPQTASRPEPDKAPEPTSTQTDPVAAPSPSAGPQEPVVSEARLEKKPEPVMADSSIKQTRQTPAQRDLSASKQIKAQLSDGEAGAAEATLVAITNDQVAPMSRYVFARGVLARGDVDRALTWVPADLAASNPSLRLVRARAILAGGDLDRAVATLQSGVPPVADNVEYRVTLATLLQQRGQSDRAANHWAELIAWDNSQAPWWVGLAIALEGRGDVPAARRAYQQAAALPGLAPSLADYVRQRLQTLGAG